MVSKSGTIQYRPCLEKRKRRQAAKARKFKSRHTKGSAYNSTMEPPLSKESFPMIP
jgi:hypothetical protein